RRHGAARRPRAHRPLREGAQGPGLTAAQLDATTRPSRVPAPPRALPPRGPAISAARVRPRCPGPRLVPLREPAPGSTAGVRTRPGGWGPRPAPLLGSAPGPAAGVRTRPRCWGAPATVA